MLSWLNLLQLSRRNPEQAQKKLILFCFIQSLRLARTVGGRKATKRSMERGKALVEESEEERRKLTEGNCLFAVQWRNRLV